MSRPVLAIDGPSGAGKGTVCQLVAQELGWSLLDSGALYRILGLAAIRAGIDLDNGDSLGQLVHKLSISFEPGSSDELQVLLAGENVTREIRTETAGDSASQVAVHPKVREALLLLQQNYVTMEVKDLAFHLTSRNHNKGDVQKRKLYKKHI